jgi:aspartate/methionine/tyrosine aminotransferase
MLSRRAQKSVNWLADEFPAQPTYPEGVVKMDSAENWLVRPAILPIYKQAIQSHLVAEHLSYNKNLGGHPGLLQATAGFANAFFAPRVAVAPEHVVAGAGAAAILDSVDFAVCEADEGLLIDAPMWEGFGLASRLRNDGRLVPVARPPEYASAEQALRHYAAAVEAAPCRVRGVIVCNPQNPYGHIYPRFWLEALLQFCEARDLHYISDEIYGMSTFEPESSSSSSSSSSVQSIYSEKEKSQPIFESPETTFTSILSMDLKRLGVNPARVHVIYGISKDLGSSGLRLVCRSRAPYFPFPSNLLYLPNPFLPTPI